MDSICRWRAIWVLWCDGGDDDDDGTDTDVGEEDVDLWWRECRFYTRDLDETAEAERGGRNSVSDWSDVRVKEKWKKKKNI